MKVRLIINCDLGQVGDEVEGPEAWRACFPTGGGIRAVPADEDAQLAVEDELDGLHALRRNHLSGLLSETAARHSLPLVEGDNDAPPAQPRDVFMFMINGAKERAPAAAMEVIARVGGARGGEASG